MSNQPMATILANLRAAKNVTQDEAAANLGVSNKTVSKWETGASLPETEYIAGIADYYGVPIGALFGRDEAKDTTDFIRKQITGLKRHEAFGKIFTLAQQLVSVAHDIEWTQEFNPRENRGGHPKIPIDYKKLFSMHNDDHNYINRTLWAFKDVFLLLLNNKNSNMAVMLTGNENNFNWLTEKAEEFLPILRFLTDKNALKAIKLFHTQSFAEKFTVDYFAKAMEISEADAEKLLTEAVALRLCQARKIYLKEGETYIYQADSHANSNGFILSALTLIHEYVCGKGGYRGYNNLGLKLIRDEAENHE